MDDFRHLMEKPDSARREDVVTDLSLRLVAEEGWSALTVRAVALRCGCTRQAVQQWFGGQTELRRVVATCFVSRWRRWFPARLRAHGLAGLAPESDEVRGWFVFRLALLEHAHREVWLADLTRFMLEEERTAMAALVPTPTIETGGVPGEPGLSLQALLTGLSLVGGTVDVADGEASFSLLARKQGDCDPLGTPGATAQPVP